MRVSNSAVDRLSISVTRPIEGYQVQNNVRGRLRPEVVLLNLVTTMGQVGFFAAVETAAGLKPKLLLLNEELR